MDFVVAGPKIANYLLANPTKSGFFLRFGYSVQNWTQLRDDILKMVPDYPLIFERDTGYGRKYAVRGDIEAPDGRIIKLTTIWMIEPNDPERLKFLTAYPT
jgi:hypothetical protein